MASMEFSFEYEHENEEGETVILSVEATMSEYSPAVMYQRNGDPGWPAEGGEIEYTSVKDPYGEEWDINKPTLVSRWKFDKDERGRSVPGTARREWVTVPLGDAMEDAAIDAAAEYVY